MSQNAREYKKIQTYVIEEINKVRLPKQTGGSGVGSSGSGGGGVVSHSLDGSSHSGTLADIQAPQFLKVDGSRALTGNLAVDAGITIDGVDLSAHVADANAHHAAVTAGNGITVDGSQVVAVRLHTDSGLQFTSAQLQIGTTNPITATSTGGVSGAAHGHAATAYFNHKTNPDHLVKSTDGGGVTFAYVSADLLTADANLTIDPTGDTLFPQAQTVRSVNYTAGIPIQGWWIGQHNINAVPSVTRNAMQIYSMTVDELRARTFVVDEVRVDRGEEFVTKSYGIVAINFITPSAVAGDITVTFENSPAFSGPIFAVDDFILFRIIDQAGGGLTIANLLFTAHDYTDLPGTFQSWRLVLVEGLTDYEILKGAVAWDFGVSGQGYIHSSVIDTSGAPYMDIRTWAGTNPLDGTVTTHLRVGKLITSLDADMAPTGWGLFSTNAYLKGILVAGAGNIRLDSGGAHIATFNSNVGATSNRLSLNWLTPTGAEKGFFGGRSWNGTDFQVMISATGVSGSSWGTIALRATKASDGVAYGLNDALPGILLVQPESIFIGPNKGLRVASVTTELATTVPGGEIYADTIHADTLIATSISGSVLGSAEWEFAGSMKIDANSGSDTVITITNEGAGRADLNVDRDIAVGGLVDGVDLSGLSSAYTAHIANASAHHAPVTAGDGITLSTQQVSVNASALADGDFGIEVFGNDFRFKMAANGGLTLAGGVSISLASPSGLQLVSNQLSIPDAIAGAGLTISSKVLAVGAGDGITIGANTVDLTTPGSVSASSTNNPVGNHTHAVTASDNPGPAVSLLRTTAAGGLTIEALTVNGAVTVGQGLTAGASGFRVIYHTHDVNHVHVAINPTGGWSLDEQFGLDIDDNLLVRGWIVGKHAIQLPGAVAIYHFDGPDTNTGGEDRSHMGQVPLVNTNGPTFVRGKFGRALSFGPGAVALITNNSFETDLTGWTAVSLTMTRVAKDAFHGGWQMQLSASAGGQAAYTFSSVNTVISTNYLFSVWLKGSADTPARIAIQNSAGTVTYGSSTITVTDEWKLFACTGAASQANTARCVIFVDDPVTIWADAAQLYEGFSTNLSFVAGTRGADAYLQYATQGMLPNVGSVMFWARPATNTAGANQNIFICATDATNRINIYIENSSQKWRTDVAGAGATSTAVAATNVWSHICVTWNSGAAQLFVNGLQQGADQAFTAFASLHSSYYLGFTSNTFRGELDDVVIVNRAVTADEVRAIYESNAPVFAETSTFQFRAGRNRVFADAEGLWVLNYAGLAAFAVYAGDDDGTGSKSWGGLTLNASDILLGDSSRGGYVKWDDSASTLEVKGTIVIQAGSTGYASITDKPTALSTINSAEGTKLAGIATGATVGATWGTNLNSVPTRFGESPSIAGLYLTGTHLGYYNGTAWKAWLASTGEFYFGGSSGAHLEWTGTYLRGIGTDGTTVQWYANSTDGKLYAGAGAVRIDVNGVNFEAGNEAIGDPNGITWRRYGNTNIDGYILTFSEAGTSSMEMWHNVRSSANSAYRWMFGGAEKMNLDGNGVLNVLGTTISLGGQQFLQYDSGNSQFRIGDLVGGDGVVTKMRFYTNDTERMMIDANGCVGIERPTPLAKLDVNQGLSTAAIPVLRLQQDDASEEFIEFVTTVGTNNPIDTDALNTYYGRARVTVNGSIKWLALYN